MVNNFNYSKTVYIINYAEINVAMCFWRHSDDKYSTMIYEM